MHTPSSPFLRSFGLLGLVAVGLILSALPLVGQQANTQPALAFRFHIVPQVGVGLPVNQLVGLQVELATPLGISPTVQINRWEFGSDCILIGPCFDSGTSVEGGVNVRVGRGSGVFQPYLGGGLGLIQRRDLFTGALYRNPTVNVRGGTDLVLSHAVALRLEARYVHLRDEPGHGEGPLVYSSAGLRVTPFGRP